MEVSGRLTAPRSHGNNRSRRGDLATHLPGPSIVNEAPGNGSRCMGASAGNMKTQQGAVRIRHGPGTESRVSRGVGRRRGCRTDVEPIE